MIRIRQIIRLLEINFVLMRYSMLRNVLGTRSPFLRIATFLNPLKIYSRNRTRGESIRLALIELGPIFVKFGQLLSTRRDLLPEDIATELALLQDQVPPFPGPLARCIVESSFHKKINEIFAYFEEEPLASASIAQVHAAKLLDGSEVVVKIRRPNIEKNIRRDIAVLYQVAQLAEKLWKTGRRLRPVELVAEFERTILDELDLVREAANASQLRRNFLFSDMLYVPKIYWDHTLPNILVMERIYGIPISYIKELQQRNTNMKKLAEHGVEIFFTQVFRDSFFHADMHPGNLFVDVTDPENPKYVGVDFGIMGTLSSEDQYYLAQNLLAFFNRDYRRIAVLHVQSGWVPLNTREDQFESAIRTVCEPIFERPLKDISFGLLLLRLFQTAERFQMEIQPQLMLLQKTLFSIEGLGRLLYPELDLWETAKPFMTRWMRKERGLRNVVRLASQNWQDTILKIAKTPRLFYEVLQEKNIAYKTKKYSHEHPQPKKFNWRILFFGAGVGLAIAWVINLLTNHANYSNHWFILPLVAIFLLISSYLIPSRSNNQT